MALAPEQAGIGIRRHFTTEGVHPYDELEWERRDARITNFRDGSVAFEQLDVEFPTAWSLNATNIVAQKYFRGTPGTPERESSLRQVIDRVADTITQWGLDGGYFVDEHEADTYNVELKHLLVTQKAAFNSPVWFNIGVPGVPQQASACFILHVDDQMDSILNWYVEEGTIFKGGSGSGINLSNIRSSVELLKGGGTASGPVSFMRGADASAGTIKSGGKTRRAAKMVILNVDHPDVEEFIWVKAREEKKIRVLEEAGFDMSLDGKDMASVQYQNANNSVRVTDEFMQAVVDDADWNLRAVTDGSVVKTVKAREVMRQISQATWECADPGMQFDTTINHWHTAANTGRINGSNPCFPGSALVHTDKGLVSFEDLVDRVREGETFGVYTHDATSIESPAERIELTSPEAVMITGRNEIVKLRFSNGMELRCTPNHRIWTTNRGYVRADALVESDEIKTLDLPTPATAASWRLPVSSEAADYVVGRDRRATAGVCLPEKWTEELAHYLGWLVGDGCISGDIASTVYGTPDEQAEVLPRHQALLAELNGGKVPKPSVQANGTVQLRVSRSAIVCFLEALGVSSGRSAAKVVPWSVLEAPTEIAAAFLRGLFDADGCVYDGATSRYVGLGSVSTDLLVGVQRLLTTFGVPSRRYLTRSSSKSEFVYVDTTGTARIYEGGDLFDIRITSHAIARFADAVGFDHSAKGARLAALLEGRRFHRPTARVHLVDRRDDGVELTYNLSEPRNHSYVVDGVVVANCSEYMHLDNSACNLASLNLLKFLDLSDDIGAGTTDSFDVDGFRRAVEIMFTGQEILVGRADYPTQAIGDTSRAFRQLGIGYANLGAMLMALGLPYDSDDGRAYAAAITSLMTGHSYATSARTADRMGAFAGYEDNKEHMLRVLRQHQEAAAEIDEELVPPHLLSAAQECWDEANELAAASGVRNAQSSVLAPTGTIGLMMDCDTTGIEPDLGLCKVKKLVGGGTMQIVNQTVPRALARLGYSPTQAAEIIAYIDENKSILGAPHLAAEHVAVFACSMGDNTIHHTGHVRMMAAVQPFISGAISKTVNLPEEATVEEVEQLHIDAWRLGVKAIAIYRDNCKVAQPLSTAKKEAAIEPLTEALTATGADPVVVERIVETIVEKVIKVPTRQKMPRQRTSRTFDFRVADCKGFVTVGEFEDGRPGEIFLRISKQGSTLAGIMDAFALSISYGLQYGVPLRVYVETFTNTRFEPGGMTDDPDLRIATSILDYIFRRLAVDYLSFEERSELNILTTGERTQPTLPGVEETVTETRQGTDIPADPPSVDASSPLLSATDAPKELSLLERAGVTGEGVAPAKPNPNIGDKPSHSDAPYCMQCGVQMQRAGSCHACPSCGSTSGCS